MRAMTDDELQAALDQVRSAPRGVGRLELIVRRPGKGEREVLERGELDTADGLVGDTWRMRPSNRTADGGPHPDMQVTVMGTRAATLLAGSVDRWPLAGDQLFVDLDLSEEHVPPGTRLAVGGAVIEVTAEPHRGCAAFTARFGVEATRLTATSAGLELKLRGINARVVQGGPIARGDVVQVLDAAAPPSPGGAGSSATWA